MIRRAYREIPGGHWEAVAREKAGTQPQNAPAHMLYLQLMRMQVTVDSYQGTIRDIQRLPPTLRNDWPDRQKIADERIVRATATVRTAVNDALSGDAAKRNAYATIRGVQTGPITSLQEATTYRDSRQPKK